MFCYSSLLDARRGPHQFGVITIWRLGKGNGIREDIEEGECQVEGGGGESERLMGKYHSCRLSTAFHCWKVCRSALYVWRPTWEGKGEE